MIVGFSTGKTPLASAIRYLTNSRISHVYVRLPVPEFNTSIVFQAAKFNTHYVNYSRFTENAHVIDEIDVSLTPEQERYAEGMRVSECGKPYGYQELIGYIWVLIGRKFGKKWKNPLYTGEAYVCVELVCKMLGIEDGATMTPQDLYELLKD